MNPVRPTPNPVTFVFFAITVLLATVAFLFFQPDEASGGVRTTTATYSHGALHLTIPYKAARSGAGELTLEVLDPEDTILGSARRHLDLAKHSLHHVHDSQPIGLFHRNDRSSPSLSCE